jgi:pimeloyl-ACP methyl ester carboxylesterase
MNTNFDQLFFDLRDIRLHAVASGPKDGEVVILLHGFPEFWISWRHQITPLADAGFRVIALDQRGYNLSDMPNNVADYRLDKLAGDIMNLLDLLHIERAHIAGHDFGASIAWLLISCYPTRFHSAVVLNVPHPRIFQQTLKTSKEQKRRSWYMFFFQFPLLPELWLRRKNFRAEINLLICSSRSRTFTDADLDAYRTAWSRPGALRSMVHWYRAGIRFGLPRRKDDEWRVSVPTLIIWGKEDIFLIPEMAQKSLEYCDRGQCLILPGVSHWINHEEPARVSNELIAHFKRHGTYT